MRVLEDTSGWLRVLRLHVSIKDYGRTDKLQKYTTNFEKTSWKDMIKMTDADLQAKGVSAQGARTKVGIRRYVRVIETDEAP